MTKYRLSQDSTVLAELMKAEREQVDNVNKAGNCIERFVKFDELPDGSADSFCELLINTLKDVGLNVKCNRRQT